MENIDIQERIAGLEQEISQLPKGSISKKNIGGRDYYYHRLNIEGKRKEEYIPADEVEELRKKIEQRKTLEAELKQLKKIVPAPKSDATQHKFITNVQTGQSLYSYTSSVGNYKKRQCYDILYDYVYGDVRDKVFILYGLRRTGKTTLIRQILFNMAASDLNKAAFIQVTAGDTLSDLNKDMKYLESHGYRYVFIDEVTLLDDFIGGAALFSDIFAACGMKIVLSGTDSLGFIFTEDEQLYDRCIMLHTTFIPYREFEQVLGIKGIDEYIKYGDTKSSVPDTFIKFTEYFFENFYSRKVAEGTLRVAKSQFKNHLSPYFGDVPLRRIVPKQIQQFIDGLEEQGKGKTAEDVFTLLNLIFKAAIKHGIVKHNPLDLVFHQKHERTHGTALTKDEEKLLLDRTAGTPYQQMFAVGLYTGLRPNEYYTAKVEGDFIVANNSKRKNGKVELKKIPITPMLAPYVKDGDELKFYRLEQIRHKFNGILPDHKLYDLRTTFYTRCTECGIAEAAIKKYVGHTLGGLADTYTDLSDEFLLSEGKKFVY